MAVAVGQSPLRTGMAGDHAGAGGAAGGNATAGGPGAPVAWILDHGRFTVLLRMSSLFLRTLREDPADAEVPSHRLLVRAGYIRRAAPGIYSWLPLGYRVYRNVERVVREEMDRDGRAGGALPRAAAARALRGHRPLDRVRRQHLPAEGPQGQRLPPRPHPRGDVHPAREGPVLLVQGPAAVDLPDPDQVPRRGPAPGGHPARPRVRHEGLVLLRRRRRGPRAQLPEAPGRVHQDVRPARSRLRDRQRDVRGDGRQQERGVPAAHRGRRGHVRPLHERRLRRERRGRRHARPPRAGLGRHPRRARRGHPRHAHHRDARGPRERPPAPRGRPRLDGGGHAEERRRHRGAPGRRPRAPRRRRAGGP